MNEKADKALEYSKITAALSAQAGSEMTRTVISELKPFNDIRKVRECLAETTEAVRLIVYKGPLPLGNFYDIKDHVKLAQKGGSLTMKQLLQTAYDLSSARKVKVFLKSDLPELPLIQSLGEVLETDKQLEEDILRCILSEDEMADDASAELKSIRRGIVRQNEAIKNRMNQIINSADNRDMLQDTVVTIRDGRHVIPVKSEYKSRVPGIVHDQSASGATLFIEPRIIVELNNELRELEAAEKAEIDRILAEFSARVSLRADALLNNQDIMVRMDLIMAKGRLSSLQRGEEPKINEEGLLQLREARHPLIDPKAVVPINVEVGGRNRSLIITGPNTGGKTVTLKTAGLLSMMAQTGLHIPASSESTIPIYTDIFADIGDEQSIEQSLSTFSSHMNNIVDIVDKACENTLVLLDELGAGTDPAEGAALAISILETLREKGTSVLATTHYTELKKYALSTAGVENASMEFDVETLSPTFRLSMGVPGRSNAFEIAGKLGLDAGMIERARKLMESGDLEFEEVISAIEADRKAAAAERDEAIAMKIAMKRQIDEMKEKTRQAEEKREKMINDAKSRARGIIAEAEDVSLDVREELKELSKIESMGERNRKFDASRRRIKDAAGRYREIYMKEVNDDPVNIKDIRPGDRVKVLSLNQNGEIISAPDEKGELTVQVGMIKARVSADDLKLIREGHKKTSFGGNAPKNRDVSYGSMYRSKAQSVAPSINLQGQNLDEATDNMEKYLDDACMAGLNEVTVIHGRGGGVLMKGLREDLRKLKCVKSFRRGSYNEGGDGVTIVSLKK